MKTLPEAEEAQQDSEGQGPEGKGPNREQTWAGHTQLWAFTHTHFNIRVLDGKGNLNQLSNQWPVSNEGKARNSKLYAYRSDQMAAGLLEAVNTRCTERSDPAFQELSLK